MECSTMTVTAAFRWSSSRMRLYALVGFVSSMINSWFISGADHLSSAGSPCVMRSTQGPSSKLMTWEVAVGPGCGCSLSPSSSRFLLFFSSCCAYVSSLFASPFALSRLIQMGPSRMPSCPGLHVQVYLRKCGARKVTWYVFPFGLAFGLLLPR